MASYNFEEIKLGNKISSDCLCVSIGMIIFWTSYLSWVYNRLT
jgi:hypothetical protein